MEIEVLNQLTLPVIVIACLIIGYILKNYIPMNNKHIPLLMAITGIALNYGINGYVSFTDTVIAGALSGLTSTGLHQIFSKYINQNQEASEQSHKEDDKV